MRRLATAIALTLSVTVQLGADDRLALQPSDRIVIAGNTLAERAALYGYIESFLHAAYPDHELTVRNLGWSGDEVDLMPRPRNFGTFNEHLTWQKTDVLFLCFGLNESFAGTAGLESWAKRLDTFLAGLRTQKFNGESPPKLVLLSPLAQEDLGAPFPTGDELAARNRDLASYTNAMRTAAEKHGALFVDLFKESQALFSLPRMPRLTVNGIHLNETGYYIASQMVARSLGLVDRPRRGSKSDIADAAALRRLVVDKNYFHFLAWRPSNSYYVWGGRAWSWEENEPMRELEQITAVVRSIDEQIWAAPKPTVATLWSAFPTGPEIWESPVDHTAYDFPQAPPEDPSVRRNGALPKGK